MKKDEEHEVRVEDARLQPGEQVQERQAVPERLVLEVLDEPGAVEGGELGVHPLDEVLLGVGSHSGG